MPFLRRYLKAIDRDELSMRAAALAYYAIFSIFPTLLLVSSVIGFVLKDPEVQGQVITRVTGLLPTQGEVVGQVVDQVVRSRGGVGITGLLGLLWSASGFFGALEVSINRAFGIAGRRAAWQSRGLGIIMALAMTPLLLLGTLLLSLSGFLAQLTFLPAAVQGLISVGINQAITLVLVVLVFVVLYRYIPLTRPAMRYTLIGAALAASAWGGVTYGFSWFLHSSFNRYALVYGSIWSVIALVIWLYLTSLIVLLGAELVAQLATNASRPT